MVSETESQQPQQLVITPSGPLQGEISVPGDKSISHRSVILASIAEGTSEIDGFLEASDTHATLQAMEDLGVKVDSLDEGHLRIHGVGLDGLQDARKPLDLGNSGTGMRLITGLLAGQSFDSQLVGDASLCRRPMGRIVSPLQEMGAAIDMKPDGTAPLHIHGGHPLQGIRYTLPMASAQVKSCLLIAGLYASEETVLTEHIVTRDHTEQLLRAFQYPIKTNRPKIFLPGRQALTATDINIPGDISSAAFFMVGACISPESDIVIRNVGINETRIGVINILSLMGAQISIDNEEVISNERRADLRIRCKGLMGIDIPLEQVPLAIDEFPVLFIAAAAAEGMTVLRGAQELRIKESDRIQVMADGLQALGANVVAREDGIAIEGAKKLRGGTVDSNGDHRVAMAFAIAGLLSENPITILGSESIVTSFPSFVSSARELGMNITEA